MTAVALCETTRPAPGVPAKDKPLDLRHLIITCSDTHPSEANGVHGVARQLAREQIAAGDRARIIFLSSIASYADRQEDIPVEVLPPAGPGIKGHVVRLQRNLLKHLLANATPDTVFHLHGGRDPLLVDIASGLRHAGIPYAVTLHGRYCHVYDNAGHCQRWVTALYLSTIERSFLARARFVQALSPFEQRIVRRVAPHAHVATIGNGAYSSRFGTAPPRPPARSPSSLFPHFSFCGRYETWHKGLDVLLEGFAEFRRGGSGFLTLIGTGERQPLIDLARSLGLGDAVEIHGPLYGADRDEVLRNSDYFVMASRFEGGPLAALEAALLGLPLLMTPGTGMSEAVAAGGAGIPIAAPTAEAVAKAMHKAAALTPAEWKECSASAYDLVVSSADWTTINARLEPLYRASAHGRAHGVVRR